MPDDSSPFLGIPEKTDWKAALPPVLMGLGTVSLFRIAPLLGLALAGAYLYDAACDADRDRRARGRSLAARRRSERLIDLASEDSFPASDPPSFTGSTGGAP